MYAENLSDAEIDEVLVRFDQTEPKLARRIMADFALRLNAIQKKLKDVVVTSGVDSGVVLLSQDGPTHWDPVMKVQVYEHQYFSPLGDALIELYEIAGGKVEE